MTGTGQRRMLTAEALIGGGGGWGDGEGGRAERPRVHGEAGRGRYKAQATVASRGLGQSRGTGHPGLSQGTCRV